MRRVKVVLTSGLLSSADVSALPQNPTCAVLLLWAKADVRANPKKSQDQNLMATVFGGLRYVGHIVLFSLCDCGWSESRGSAP